MAHCCIHQLINLRNGIRVLRANLLQICEIYTHTPLFVLLLHYHSVRQLLRVKNLLDCPNLFQLVYFYPYCLNTLF